MILSAIEALVSAEKKVCVASNREPSLPLPH